MPSNNLESRTVGYLLEKWKENFITSNVPQAKESAELIMAHILETKEISDVYNAVNQELGREKMHRLDHLCKKRLERTPMPYILKEWKFRSLNLKMSPPVFIPWIETEHFIDYALEAIDDRNAQIALELCCGSGAICLAILNERPQLKMIGVDKSIEACQLTKENAETLKLSDRLQIIQSRITARGEIAGIPQKFDVIVSNPPYVPFNNIKDLGPEFNDYQDIAAVESGDDGLIMIKIVLHISSRMLNKDGKLIMEVNPTHPELIQNWLDNNDELGLKMLRWMKDFNGLGRYVEVVKID